MPGDRTRKEARDYWDTHDIPEDASEIEVAVKRGPTTVLSVRMDRDRLDRLKGLAAAAEIGVVTMARRLLSQAIDGAAAHSGGSGMPASENSPAARSPRRGATGISARGAALTLTTEDAATLLDASELMRAIMSRLSAQVRGDMPVDAPDPTVRTAPQR